MRSSSIAWYLSRAGLSVRVLRGGYAAFRRWARGLWDCQLVCGGDEGGQGEGRGQEEKGGADGGVHGGADGGDVVTCRGCPCCLGCKRQTYRVCVVGGRTGVGKTAVLEDLAARGEQVIHGVRGKVWEGVV